jgi:hypothetical protein
VGFAVLAGCGGGGFHTPTPLGGGGSSTSAPNGSSTAAPTASPTLMPTPTPTPIVINASPSSIAFGGLNGSQAITVSEHGFTGTFTATSNDTTIVAVSPPTVNVSTSGSPASTGVFLATSIGIGTNQTGTASILISDGHNTITIPVTVSVTSGIITFWTTAPARPKS